MLDRTYQIVGVTCAVIGGAGYAMYGDAVKDEVTLNLPAGIASTGGAGAPPPWNPLSKIRAHDGPRGARSGTDAFEF